MWIDGGGTLAYAAPADKGVRIDLAGVWLVDKPADLTSAQVIGRLKQRLGCMRIGHAGTLDPMATGLLVCLVNRATRLAAYAEAGIKTYSGTIDLGISTESDDMQGRILRISEYVPDFERVQMAAQSLVGVIHQVPPCVSAIKVKGVRAYQAARAGHPLKLQARRVEIYEFDLKPISVQRVAFRVRCSKGTYIRALARDLGERLGCGACLSGLRREGSDPFSVEQALPLESVTWKNLLTWTCLFPKALRLEVEGPLLEMLKNGNQSCVHRFMGGVVSDAAQAVYVDRISGRACGLLVKQRGAWRLAINME